ncbi:serine/threonine protein kinase [Serinibacter arcticus]|uniref:non-specific serine/threonine protein kinase n=1 Tax=Serinibacter arcticus TaxID=1655435 RepID=A0A2U1ZVZ1_9MICO|nr:serine/threonine-protein kinase [Serinibacter arcticus]PWD51148.1 serine/threonine protein kinase [Serinibacter arcticus]
MTPRAGVVLDGRYELTERIAIGGMGEVWSAVEIGSGQRFAAKVMRPEFAGEQLFLDRIAAEARNSLRLEHPGIARTYDSGVIGGLGYLVMELVEGETLATVLRRERTLTPRTILDVLAQTADALAAAHAQGVVHRDIKPGNLLLTADGKVKLTDFGISIGENQAPMTDAGMVMGTAQYLPPEQAMGKPATGAGDVYALGIIAYEALAGRRPFTGATQVDIAFAHVTEKLPPLPGTVDEPLRELVTSMLEKDPERRPASAAVVAERARSLLAELESGAWDPRRAIGAWRSPRKGRTTTAGEGSPSTSRRGRTDGPRSTTPPGERPPGTHQPGARRNRARRPSRAREVIAAVGIVVLAALITLAILTVANLGSPAAHAAAAVEHADPSGPVTAPAARVAYEQGELAPFKSREVLQW